MTRLQPIAIAHHRNGICGAPFDVILFEDSGTEGSRKVGVVFEQPYHVAVLDVDLLSLGNITFGQNSWRGDCYEPSLRRHITEAQCRSHLASDEPQSTPQTPLNQTKE